MRAKYTVENLAQAIAANDSWRKVCETLGLFYCQASLKRLRAKADNENLSYAHFLGKATWTGKASPLRKPALEGKRNSHSLKLALIRDGLKKHQCEECLLTEWRGKPIPITLHHIDGNKHNDAYENLQILCGNCHMQTENFGRKNPMRYNRLITPRAESFVSETKNSAVATTA